MIQSFLQKCKFPFIPYNFYLNSLTPPPLLTAVFRRGEVRGEGEGDVHDDTSAGLCGGQHSGVSHSQQAAVLPRPQGDLRPAGGGGGDSDMSHQHQAGV